MQHSLVIEEGNVALFGDRNCLMIQLKRVKWHSLVINEGKVAQFDD